MSGISCLRYTQSGRRTVSVTLGGHVQLHDGFTGDQLASTVAFQGQLWSVDVNLRSGLVAAGTGVGDVPLPEFEVLLLRLPDLAVCSRIGGFAGCVYAVALAPDGMALAAGEGPPSGTRLGVFAIAPQMSGQDGTTESPGGRAIMFSKPGAEITFQDVMHAMDYEDSREGRDAGMLWGTVGHAEWVASTGPACLHAVAWSPSGREIACGSSDGTAIVWDAIRHRPRWEWHAHPEAVNDMRFDPRGVSLLMGSDDGTVSHWLLAGSEPMLPGAISSGSRAVNCLDVSPDGDRVAFGTVDGYVGVWDIIRGRELARANLGSEVTAIAYSPSGTRLACGDGAGNVSVLGVDAVDATAIPRTLIVRDGIPTLDCPSCWEAGSDDWPGVQIANPQLGSEIECPGPCGRRLWLNDHVAASYDASPAPLRETRVVFALLALASAYLIQAEDRLTEAGDDVSQHDGLDLGQVLLCVRSIVSLDTQAPDDQARLRTAVARLSNPDMRWATTQSVRECAAVLTALQHDLTGGSMRDSFALLHQVMGLQAIMESGPWLDPVFTGIRALPGEDTLHAVDARLAQCVRSMTSIAEEVECGQADLESMLGPISGFWNALQACAPTERGFGCV